MNLTTHLEYQLVAQARARELKLLVRLHAPPAQATTRKPLNLGVVIDRSGSMSGDKIEHTRRALQTLITHLGPEDHLSLVLFDDHVQVLLEPTRVTDKDALKQLVAGVDTGGSTNLSAGWLKGINLIARNASPDRVNRCLLLTDGQANVGIQDPAQLAFMGRSARQERNIVTTTLGFGEGFNEDLLTGIAREAGGAFYYVDQADQAPAIFQEELQGLLRLAAQNVEVRVTPAPPVKFVAQWTDYPARSTPGHVTFALGDAYAGEEKNLLLSLGVPGLAELGPALLGRLEVSYAEISSTAVVQRQITQELRVQVADTAQAEDTPPDVQVQQHYALQLAARARRQAIEEADRGNYEQAGRMLNETAAVLSGLEAPGCAVEDEISDLRQQALQLDAAHYGHSRKVLRETASHLASGRLDRVRSARARRQGPPRGQRAPA